MKVEFFDASNLLITDDYPYCKESKEVGQYRYVSVFSQDVDSRSQMLPLQAPAGAHRVRVSILTWAVKEAVAVEQATLVVPELLGCDGVAVASVVAGGSEYSVRYICVSKTDGPKPDGFASVQFLSQAGAPLPGPYSGCMYSPLRGDYMPLVVHSSESTTRGDGFELRAPAGASTVLLRFVAAKDTVALYLFGPPAIEGKRLPLSSSHAPEPSTVEELPAEIACPVDSATVYCASLTLEHEGEEARKGALATIAFYDANGTYLAEPYDRCLQSKTAEQFRYLSVGESGSGKAGQCLVIRPPAEARELRLRVRHWQVRSGLRFTTPLRLWALRAVPDSGLLYCFKVAPSARHYFSLTSVRCGSAVPNGLNFTFQYLNSSGSLIASKYPGCLSSESFGQFQRMAVASDSSAIEPQHLVVDTPAGSSMLVLWIRRAPTCRDAFVSRDIELERIQFERPAFLEGRSEIRIKDLKNLRLAGVMDEFSSASFAPECSVLPLTPTNWQQELTEFRPHLVFIESAWQGKDGLWNRKISALSEELASLLSWCRERRIPSVFWNKEDPMLFDVFIAVAAACDHVFTTDVDCIPDYVKRLGHRRVHLLQFACQPRHCNPLEKYARKDAFCFAGSYYLKYAERQRDLDALLNAVRLRRPVEIFDRNYGKEHPHYRFPEEYQPLIQGSLSFEQIDYAYKGYNYGINMNTIKQSQSMFARRVFELLGSNTITVSNYSRGLRLLFGDLVISSDSERELAHQVGRLTADPTRFRKQRLAALRKVLMDHTYAERLSRIASRVWNLRSCNELPPVVVFGVVSTEAELSSLVRSIGRQIVPGVRGVIVVAGNAPVPGALPPEVMVLDEATAQITPITSLVAADAFAAGMSPDDYYGPCYLMDLVLSTRYCSMLAYGKSAHLRNVDGFVSLQADGTQYRVVRELPYRAAAASPQLLPDATVGDFVQCIASGVLRASEAPGENEGILAIDEFSYCRDGMALPESVVVAAADDIADLFQGTTAHEWERFEADSLEAKPGAAVMAANDSSTMPGRTLLDDLDVLDSAGVDLTAAKSDLVIVSRLAGGRHKYLYSRGTLTREGLSLVNSTRMRIDGFGRLDSRVVFEYQDAEGNKLAHTLVRNGTATALPIPKEATQIRLGLRVEGSGKACIRRLVSGEARRSPPMVLGASRSLLISKQYPSYDDLYKYGFVHRRVVEYRASGTAVDVYRVDRAGGGLSFREFEGIDVTSGSLAALDSLLRQGRHSLVLIHVLDEHIWKVIEKHLSRVRVLVWVHGSEAQSWQRREFEFERFDEEEIARQKRLSDRRMELWRRLFTSTPKNVEFVFVSRYFADEVMDNAGAMLPSGKYHIVHNFIDTDLFAYTKKPPEQRKKLFSVRPYTSRKYANDLTVNAILELSRRPFFSELEFSLIGDGALFEETVAPLREFGNVKLEKRFLTQPAIAQLHREFGVLLSPTRMDAQGVSRDEAMSSGLVPITTRVTAIPEFVDEASGLLVDGEDYLGIAAAVERLYADPELFERLSQGAAARVRRQSGPAQTVGRELEIMNAVGAHPSAH